ncbi:uncharacterized protein BX663DRAFT_514262 [Cokeromyces recurvatus]|uniref:uncharacterized protein n=1 Tax=Cokeromyces recurvatus TaxID=90255 RepID=UPI0022212983|nr:uncharacterized protein BX663DRAFT_514262 [Cokeromyces recurvatus]KAI7901376.1 hypothetical protein BX663DRAFT_514262 [Cokeromyces recurvatus]
MYIVEDNDGETNVTLQKEEFTLPKLSHEEEEDSSQQDSDDFISIYTKKPGRKPMSNEESLSDLDQDPKIKRKAQNRAAQRAFRERKERYVKELEARLKQVQDTYLIVTTELVQENQQLRDVIQRLDAENCVLKGSIPVSSSYPFNENISSQFPNMNPLLSITNHPSSIASLPFCLLSTTASSTLSSNSIKTLASNDPLQPYSSISSSIHMQNKDHDLSSSITKSLPTSLPVKKILSKPSSSSSTATTTTTNQPLEYTFSISTPASLRPTERSKATKQPSEPIKLVQLYPPNESLQSIKSRRKGNNNDNATVMKKSLPNKTVSITNGTKKEVMNHNKEADKIHNMNDNQMFTTNIASSSNNIILQDNTSSINHDNFTTHSQYKGMQQLESSMLDCHIDIERHLFCEKLRYEVCGGQLDPLSDQKGKLNKSIPTQHDPLQPFLIMIMKA